MMRRRVFTAAAILLSVPALMQGQILRGTVADERDAPVAGVLVQLLDSGTTVITRTLSNERGEYRLMAPTAGTYRVRTQRIGFRPVSYGPFLLRPGGDASQRLVLTGLPVRLNTVAVVGTNPCRSLGDSTAGTYLVWEQVRGALAGLQLTANGQGEAATTLLYERIIEPAGRIREQTSSIRAESMRQPWRSLSSDSLSRAGYVIAHEDGSMTYQAPGLDVLLSDLFLVDHCFRIAPTSDAGRVGIAFEPTPARRRIAEIQGTLWVDRKSSELRSMEFRYANIVRERAERAGGDMEFVRRTNGAWVISHWEIRMPLLERRAGRATSGVPGALPVSEVRVTGIKISGGELLMVRRGSDTLWARAPLVLAGSVADSVSGRPVEGARVTLIGTSLTGVTNAAGGFTVADVLPGAYEVEVRTPSLDSIGAVHRSRVGFTDPAVSFQIRTPAARQRAGTICAGSGTAPAPASDRRGLIAGALNTRGDTLALRNAKIVAEWREPSSDARVATAGAKRTRWVEARTDARGLFRICDAPVNTALVLQAETENRSSAPVRASVPGDQRFTHVSLTLDESTDRGAIFTGIVLDDSARGPIADVEVVLPELPMSVVTNDVGGFRLVDIPPGTHRVVVRRVGYGPFDMRMPFVSNHTLERRIILSRAMALESVIVTADRTTLPDFEANRRLGQGHFLTRADLARYDGRKISDALSQAPGARIMAGAGSQAWMTTTRGARSVEIGPRIPDAKIPEGAKFGACYTQVWLDRMLMYAGKKDETPFDINTIPAEQVEAVEFYSSPAQTPPKYMTRNSACGVLVIHTRRSP